MKLKIGNISINEILNQNAIFHFIIHSFLLTLFFVFKIYRKIFYFHGKTVMIISLHKLGDTIFTIPAIREVHKIYGVNTVVICTPDSIPIYKLAFENINIIELSNDEYYFGNRIATSNARRRLKSLKPTIVIDITGSMKSASLIFNLRAKKIVGTNGDQFRSIYDCFIKFRESPKLLDIYLDAISPLVVTSTKRNISNKLISFNPEGKILIHPFAGWEEKEWKIKKFIELAAKLNSDYKVNLIVQQNQLSDDVRSELQNLNIELVVTESVDELINEIKRCSLFVGNDSGPVNIANFLGKPTLTIYGATNSDYTATNVDHQLYIQKKLCCSAGNNEKFCVIGVGIYKCSGTQCMNLLSLEVVYNTLLPLLNSYCKKKAECL